jgi:hypothetical protein
MTMLARLSIAIATLLLPVHTHAQANAPRIPRGSFYYVVDAVYNGENGQPWDGLIEVKDTTVAGKPAISFTYRSRRNDTGSYLFNSNAVWLPGDSANVKSVETGEGHEPGSCAVDIASDGAKMQLNAAKPEPVTLAHGAVAEFALPGIVASRTLSDGVTIHQQAYRCSWSQYAPKPVITLDFDGVVSSSTLPRTNGAAPEPVWVVTGKGDYSVAFWIAKSDRTVLKAFYPMGIGSMTQTLTRAEPAK